MLRALPMKYLSPYAVSRALRCQFTNDQGALDSLIQSTGLHSARVPRLTQTLFNMGTESSFPIKMSPLSLPAACNGDNPSHAELVFAGQALHPNPSRLRAVGVPMAGTLSFGDQMHSLCERVLAPRSVEDNSIFGDVAGFAGATWDSLTACHVLATQHGHNMALVRIHPNTREMEPLELGAEEIATLAELTDLLLILPRSEKELNGPDSPMRTQLLGLAASAHRLAVLAGDETVLRNDSETPLGFKRIEMLPSEKASQLKLTR